MKSQKELKHDAKKLLSGHKWFYFSMYLPYIFLVVAAYLMFGYVHHWNVATMLDDKNNIGIDITSIITQIFIVGITYAMIDIRRNKTKRTNALQKAFTLFNNPRYLIDVILISLLIGIFTMLWFIFFIIPAFIKTYSYSQALNIYKDSVDRGEPMSAIACITASRKLMNGHKMELFMLQLSFVGWFILGIATLGIGFCYIMPYYAQTNANYYVEISKNLDITSIADNSYL